MTNLKKKWKTQPDNSRGTIGSHAGKCGVKVLSLIDWMN